MLTTGNSIIRENKLYNFLDVKKFKKIKFSTHAHN